MRGLPSYQRPLEAHVIAVTAHREDEDRIARTDSAPSATAAPSSTMSLSRNPCAGCIGESAPGVVKRNEMVVANVPTAIALPMAPARADNGRRASRAAATSSVTPMTLDTAWSLRMPY